MSYTPTNWKAGDTVTSAKLNKMEQGIANNGGILRVNIHNIDGSLVADKTWQQIKDAQFAIFVSEDSDEVSISNTYYYIMELYRQDNPQYNASEYTIILRNTNNYRTIELTTDDSDGYPSKAASSGGELPK